MARERVTGDGFGVGWYVEGDATPCVFTSVMPAWNNPNLLRLADKIKSNLVFAHVRAASANTPISESNCHPWAYLNYMWMHNGYIADFVKVRAVQTALKRLAASSRLADPASPSPVASRRSVQYDHR